jgi:Reverse transcriptase (RNA-dependent DNA polymerase)
VEISKSVNKDRFQNVYPIYFLHSKVSASSTQVSMTSKRFRSGLEALQFPIGYGLQLPFKIVRLLHNLLKQKNLYFYINDQVWAQRTVFKGLPQGSVLSPILYNINGAGIDFVLSPGVSILQYADDIVLYKSGRILQEMQESLQACLDSIEIFYSELGLEISSGKSEIVLFSKKLPKIKPKLCINKLPLQVSDQFKYLGIILDRGLT